MRLSNASDQQIMRSAIPDNAAGALEFISALNNREAIAFGEAVATAMRMTFTLQDESMLPRMSSEWEEQAAAPEEPAAAAPISLAIEPRPAPKLDPKPNSFSRFQEPIAAPAYGGWRTDKPAGDSPLATRDWPSSERLRR